MHAKLLEAAQKLHSERCVDPHGWIDSVVAQVGNPLSRRIARSLTRPSVSSTANESGSDSDSDADADSNADSDSDSDSDSDGVVPFTYPHVSLGEDESFSVSQIDSDSLVPGYNLTPTVISVICMLLLRTCTSGAVQSCVRVCSAHTVESSEVRGTSIEGASSPPPARLSPLLGSVDVIVVPVLSQ
jgi:hypothetical protein